MRLQRGFTLIELLITVAIVGILAAIAVPSWSAMVSKSRQTEAKLGLAAIHSLETAYHGVANRYGSLTEIGFVSEGEGRYGYLISADSFVSPTLDVDTGGSDNPLFEVLPGEGVNFFTSADDDDDDDGGPTGPPTGTELGYGIGNPHYDGNSFEVVAVGVISASPAPNDLDIWSIDDFHTLENINFGF